MQENVPTGIDEGIVMANNQSSEFKSRIRAACGTNGFAVIGRDGSLLATLRLIRSNDLQDEDLIKMLTDLRNRHRTCFLTEFEATVERTRAWLATAVVDHPARALFRVDLPGGRLVGHVGAIHRGEALEYDNFILDDDIGIKGFAVQLAQQFLVWIAKTSGLNAIFGNVRSSNAHARDFHKRTGFFETEKIPLKRIVLDNGDVAFRELNIDGVADLYIIRITATVADLISAAVQAMPENSNRDRSRFVNSQTESRCFADEVAQSTANMGEDAGLHAMTTKWMDRTAGHRYTYNFSWLGRPIIQYPQDMIAVQEIIWQVKPDLIIETGIAHGGSLIFYASMLELNAACGGPHDAGVLGIDIEVRPHNREAIEKHPMFKRISMIEGSSIDKNIARQVYDFAKNKKRIMVLLDSMHTHGHVLKELEFYSSLVTKESYLVVFDTIIEDMPEDFFPDRPWGKGNNPKTAVWEFLKKNGRFEIDKGIENKLLITVAPGGYLKCVKE